MADEASNVGADVIAYANKELNGLELVVDEAKGVLKDAKADLKAALKRYEGYGIDTEALLLSRKIQREGAEEYRAKMAKVGEYLRAVRDPQGFLFEGFEDPARETVEMRAEYEGYQSSLRGESIQNCPYDPGEPGRKPWEKGFLEGQKVCAAGLAKITLPEDDEPEAEDEIEQDDLPETMAEADDEPDAETTEHMAASDDWQPEPEAFDDAEDPALVP